MLVSEEQTLEYVEDVFVKVLVKKLMSCVEVLMKRRESVGEESCGNIMMERDLEKYSVEVPGISSK